MDYGINLTPIIAVKVLDMQNWICNKQPHISRLNVLDIAHIASKALQLPFVPVHRQDF